MGNSDGIPWNSNQIIRSLGDVVTVNKDPFQLVATNVGNLSIGQEAAIVVSYDVRYC